MKNVFYLIKKAIHQNVTEHWLRRQNDGNFILFLSINLHTLVWYNSDISIQRIFDEYTLQSKTFSQTTF